jgi:hypothetical protein
MSVKCSSCCDSKRYDAPIFTNLHSYIKLDPLYMMMVCDWREDVSWEETTMQHMMPSTEDFPTQGCSLQQDAL